MQTSTSRRITIREQLFRDAAIPAAPLPLGSSSVAPVIPSAILRTAVGDFVGSEGDSRILLIRRCASRAVYKTESAPLQAPHPAPSPPRHPSIERGLVLVERPADEAREDRGEGADLGAARAGPGGSESHSSSATTARSSPTNSTAPPTRVKTSGYAISYADPAPPPPAMRSRWSRHGAAASSAPSISRTRTRRATNTARNAACEPSIAPVCGADDERVHRVGAVVRRLERGGGRRGARAARAVARGLERGERRGGGAAPGACAAGAAPTLAHGVAAQQKRGLHTASSSMTGSGVGGRGLRGRGAAAAAAAAAARASSARAKRRSSSSSSSSSSSLKSSVSATALDSRAPAARSTARPSSAAAAAAAAAAGSAASAAARASANAAASAPPRRPRPPRPRPRPSPPPRRPRPRRPPPPRRPPRRARARAPASAARASGARTRAPPSAAAAASGATSARGRAAGVGASGGGGGSAAPGPARAAPRRARARAPVVGLDGERAIKRVDGADKVAEVGAQLADLHVERRVARRARELGLGLGEARGRVVARGRRGGVARGRARRRRARRAAPRGRREDRVLCVRTESAASWPPRARRPRSGASSCARPRPSGARSASQPAPSPSVCDVPQAKRVESFANLLRSSNCSIVSLGDARLRRCGPAAAHATHQPASNSRAVKMATAKADKPRVHGSGGVYCGGEWLSIEDCGDWQAGGACGGEECKECPSAAADDAAAGALRAASNKPGARARAAGEARACATSFTAARPTGRTTSRSSARAASAGASRASSAAARTRSSSSSARTT